MPYSPEGTLYRGPHVGVVEYEPHAAPSHIVHNVVPAPAPLVHDVIDHVPLGHHAVPVHHEVIPVHHKAIHHAVHPNIIHDSYAPKPHHVVHAKPYHAPAPVHPPAYHHPPPHYAPEYPDEPRLYKYAYSVDDDYEGAILNVGEESDEYATHGHYEVSLDDGRHQSVSYVSDKHGGYKAKVAYKDQHSSYTRT